MFVSQLPCGDACIPCLSPEAPALHSQHSRTGAKRIESYLQHTPSDSHTQSKDSQDRQPGSQQFCHMAFVQSQCAEGALQPRGQCGVVSQPGQHGQNIAVHGQSSRDSAAQQQRPGICAQHTEHSVMTSRTHPLSGAVHQEGQSVGADSKPLPQQTLAAQRQTQAVAYEQGQQEAGVLRRKPGRGEATLSMSCSDKLAKWCCLGLQASITS